MVLSFFWRYDNDTGDLYMHSLTDPNVAEIKYATNFPLIMENTSYINIRNLDVQGGWTSIFVFSRCHHITFSNLEIGKYALDGIITNSDASSSADYPQNILIESCFFDAFFALDYSSSSIYSGNSDVRVGDGFRPQTLLNSEIKNCYFKN